MNVAPMNAPPQTMVQATTIPMSPTGTQLIQMPNGQLFMLPMNSYPATQPVALQAVQPAGVNNEAFKEPEK